MRTLPRHAALLAILVGCKHETEGITFTTIVEPIDSSATGVWLGEGLGTSPVAVPVFATNDLGAPVPGTVDVNVDGAAATVSTDGSGWGTVSVAGVGHHTLTADESEGAAWVVRAQPGSVDMPMFPIAPELMSRVPGGLAWAVDGEVWFTPVTGGPAARVLALPDPVTALVRASIDDDGIQDLMVVSAGNVVLLRGRSGGGLVWGGGFSSTDGRTFSAANPGNADGDPETDLAFALTDGESTGLTVLLGDGTGAFETADTLEVAYTVSGISANDLNSDGLPELTALTNDGLLRRYTRVDGIWGHTDTGWEIDLGLGADGHMAPSVDVTWEGDPDFVVWGPSADGASAILEVVDAAAASPHTFTLVGPDDDAEWVGVTTGDASGDGMADVVFSTPGVLGLAAAQPSTLQVSHYDAPEATPIVEVVDVTADAVYDVAFASDVVRFVPVAFSGDDWGLANPDSTLFGLDLLSEPAVQDVDGDGVVDVVALVEGSDGTELTGFHGMTDENLVAGRSLALEGAVDLAVCGTRAFVLYEGGLARVDLNSALDATLVGDPIAVDAAFVACETDGAVVADTDGALSYVDADGNLTPGESIGPVGDLAVRDGVPVACAEAGCFVGVADLDGDGSPDVAEQTSAGVTVTLAGGSFDMEAAGTLRLDDTDGDGTADLVFNDGGVVTIRRMTADGPTPPVGSWVDRPVSGAVRFGDLNGDGQPDAFFFGDATDATFAGALVYAGVE